MGQLGRRRARERYDWSVVIKAYEDIWNDGFAKSRILRKARSHSANCPPHYRSQQIFSHYPSHPLTSTDVVTITAEGKVLLEANDESELTISPNGTIDLDSVRRLLESADVLGPTSIAELADQFIRNTGSPRLIVFTTIAFSLKYNFLKLRDSRT
jgi:alpha-maltose-1-phosphate synthase